jgi:hypothetical protein
LLAYPDIDNSPSAPLLDLSCRDLLATKLNSAILGKPFLLKTKILILVFVSSIVESQSKPASSALEKDYQQVVAVNKQLMYEGNGKAALLKLNSLDSIGHSPL